MQKPQLKEKRTMNKLRGLKVKSGGVLNSEAFSEASREELRVLVAVMESPYAFACADELAAAAGVSKARAASAIALFSEAGIFIREGELSYEFENTPAMDDAIERTAKEVAENIRKRELCDLFSELASMMERDALNTDEIKRINSLIADEGLSQEYILTLAAYLTENGGLAVKKLTRRAENLIKSEIDTVERLDDYIKRQESGGSLIYEFRRTFGKWGGNVTKSELGYYRKWTQTYGFLPEIILLAQDKNVLATTKYSYSYMDTLLTRWHECGCKTAEDCEGRWQEDRLKIQEERKRENSQKHNESKSKSPAPKFGDFDPGEALKRAIERSYAKYADDDEA